MTTRSYRWLAVLIFIGGMVCLALTATMNFLQGEALGVTDAGKWVNSISSVVVDVVGLLLFGLGAGACLAAKRWIPATIFATIVVLSAGWSINSMIGFQASERLSAAEAFNRDMDRMAQADKIAADSASWFTRMTRNVGRSARRDYIAAQRESIKDLREAKVEARVDPGAGTKVIARFTKSEVETVATAQISYLALLLIFLKAVSFPASAFFWAPLAVKQDGSASLNQGGSSGSGGSGKGEPRSKLKVVGSEPAKIAQSHASEPAYKPSSVGTRVSTDAPQGKLTYEQFAETIRVDMAHGEPSSTTRSLAEATRWSQSSVVRQQERVRGRAKARNKQPRRYAGNGGGMHPAMG